MTYIISALIILWVAMTRAHNTPSFPTQDALLIVGAFVFVYGVVLVMWNLKAGAKRWWL